MSKRTLLLGVAILVIAVSAVAIWRIQAIRANQAIEGEILRELSGEAIRLILASQADNEQESVPVDSETRMRFLGGMREYMALAAAARAEGMTSEPAFRVNFSYKKNILLGDLYQRKLTKESGTHYVVSTELLDGVWKDPVNEKQFEIDIRTMQEIQNAVARERGENYTVSKLQGASLVKAKENWARTKILSDLAKADGDFMAQRVVDLRLKVLEAGILSADYLRKHWATKVRATETEVADYLRANPQFDVGRKRALAEQVLKEALNGADFSELAKKYSEDRTTKANGGLYENVEPGSNWEEVEKAASEVSPGTVVGRIIESTTGFHIIKLVSKNSTAAASGSPPRLTFRHVLLQKKFEDTQNVVPGVPPPFLSPEEIAISAIEARKRKQFIEEVIAANPIVLPDDFAVGYDGSRHVNEQKFRIGSVFFPVTS